MSDAHRDNFEIRVPKWLWVIMAAAITWAGYVTTRLEVLRIGIEGLQANVSQVESLRSDLVNMRLDIELLKRDARDRAGNKSP